MNLDLMKRGGKERKDSLFALGAPKLNKMAQSTVEAKKDDNPYQFDFDDVPDNPSNRSYDGIDLRAEEKGLSIKEKMELRRLRKGGGDKKDCVIF